MSDVSNDVMRLTDAETFSFSFEDVINVRTSYENIEYTTNAPDKTRKVELSKQLLKNGFKVSSIVAITRMKPVQC